MWSMIRASVSLVIATGLAYIRIRAIAGGDDPNAEKIQGIENQLKKVSAKLDSLAASTDPTWDDTLADIFSEWLTELAELIVGELSDTNTTSTGG